MYSLGAVILTSILSILFGIMIGYLISLNHVFNLKDKLTAMNQYICEHCTTWRCNKCEFDMRDDND